MDNHIIFVIIGVCLLCTFATAAPVADFYSDVVFGYTPLDVQFTDSSTGSPTSWLWFFGEKTYSTEPWVQMSNTTGIWDRYMFPMVVLSDSSIIVMGGGTGTGGFANDVYRSTDSGVTWTTMTSFASWQGRTNHKSVAMPDGSIVMMGGLLTRNAFKNDVWRSINKGATWTQLAASSGWSGRYGHSCVVLPDGSIILMGGRPASGGYLNDVWMSTNNGASWTQLKANNGNGWVGRFSHTTLVMPDGSIILMGGSTAAPVYFNDTWRSIDNGATWTLMNASCGWTARDYLTSVVMPDDSIIIMGGRSGATSYNNDTWRSTDMGATWTQLPDANWPKRYAHGSVVLQNGSIITVAGSGTGGIIRDSWKFSLGGLLEQNPIHTYTESGVFDVMLRVSDSSGNNRTLKSGYITVETEPPYAGFTSDVISGYPTFTVWFNDTSTGGTPDEWNWSFGDGYYSDEQNPFHNYASVIGNSTSRYTVSLYVSNDGGSDTLLRSNYCTAYPLNASFTTNSTTGTLPLAVQFTDLTDNGTPTAWNWTFGDGAYSDEQNPVHTYTSAGTYDVTLNASNVYSYDIETTAGPEPIPEPTPESSSLEGSDIWWASFFAAMGCIMMVILYELLRWATMGKDGSSILRKLE
jgi:PKD repeat protein